MNLLCRCVLILLCLAPVQATLATTKPEPAPAQAPDLESIDHPGRLIVSAGSSQGALACAACHGMDGSGRVETGIPRLAGQSRSYLIKQLNDFQSESRGHFTMAEVAKKLSDADIIAVADYFAGLPPVEPRASSARTEVLAMGFWIAERGIATKGVAACNSCHGPNGQGLGPLFPRLTGQSASYMRRQLTNLGKGDRTNDMGAMMQGIAEKLSPAEVRAVAEYYQSLGAQEFTALR